MTTDDDYDIRYYSYNDYRVEINIRKEKSRKFVWGMILK